MYDYLTVIENSPPHIIIRAGLNLGANLNSDFGPCGASDEVPRNTDRLSLAERHQPIKDSHSLLIKFTTTSKSI